MTTTKKDEPQRDIPFNGITAEDFAQRLKEKTYNTYTVYMTCSNCGANQTVLIQKGVQVGKQQCHHCGCSTLRRKEMML